MGRSCAVLGCSIVKTAFRKKTSGEAGQETTGPGQAGVGNGESAFCWHPARRSVPAVDRAHSPRAGARAALRRLVLKPTSRAGGLLSDTKHHAAWDIISVSLGETGRPQAQPAGALLSIRRQAPLCCRRATLKAESMTGFPASPGVPARFSTRRGAAAVARTPARSTAGRSRGLSAHGGRPLDPTAAAQPRRAIRRGG
jgi:hypothetical protein